MADKPERPVPNAETLREAALNYLARFAATEAGLRRVLQRRIDRWARETADRDDMAEKAAAAAAEIPGIVARMVALELLNDAAFAERHAKGLALGGRSRRVIAARLMAKGVAAGLARSAVPDDAETELTAALILSRKRRIGPFRLAEAGDRTKELGVLARAGFPRDVALRALAMDLGQAEETIRTARE